MKALDIEAVQAFVLVADLNSFTRAAEAMDTTQSAVSLKIKRLEDGLGRRLLWSEPRGWFACPPKAMHSCRRHAIWSPRISRRSVPLRSSIAGWSSASAIISSVVKCRRC